MNNEEKEKISDTGVQLSQELIAVLKESNCPGFMAVGVLVELQEILIKAINQHDQRMARATKAALLKRIEEINLGPSLEPSDN